MKKGDIRSSKRKTCGSSVYRESSEPLEFWRLSGNQKIQKKIADLIEDTRKNPEEGKGKPEKLKYRMAGKWSRRITDEHRMIYSVEETLLVIHALKGHYA